MILGEEGQAGELGDGDILWISGSGGTGRLPSSQAVEGSGGRTVTGEPDMSHLILYLLSMSFIPFIHSRIPFLWIPFQDSIPKFLIILFLPKFLQNNTKISGTTRHHAIKRKRQGSVDFLHIYAFLLLCLLGRRADTWARAHAYLSVSEL